MSIDLTALPEKHGTLDLPDPDAPSAAADSSAYVPAADGPATSDLELIAADLAIELDDDRTIPIPTRSGYAIRVNINISGDEIDVWRKASKSKRHADGVDGMKLDALVLVNKTTGILKNGELLEDAVGQPLTFRHRQFLDLLKNDVERRNNTDLTAADGVRRFIGRDGVVDGIAKELLSQAGWGDEVYASEGDPTVGA